MVWGLSTAHRQAVPQLADDHLAQTHTGTEFVMQQLQHHETPCNICNSMQHHVPQCNSMQHKTTQWHCNNVQRMQQHAPHTGTEFVTSHSFSPRRSKKVTPRRSTKGIERQGKTVTGQCKRPRNGSSGRVCHLAQRGVSRTEEPSARDWSSAASVRVVRCVRASGVGGTPAAPPEPQPV